MPDGPWIDMILFNIGSLAITPKILISTGGIIGIIIGIIAFICCIIAYRKRERIAIEAVRASMYLKRASTKLRRSIRRTLG